MSRAEFIIQESAGFAPTGKYHLSWVRHGVALCGRKPSTAAGWNVSGEREPLECLAPERICKNCRKADPSARVWGT